MSRTVALVILWTLSLLGPPRAAADSIRLGAAGAQELRIPVGPRGTALGGAAISDAKGVEALYWNPAGASAEEQPEFLFSTMSYLLDSHVHFVGYTQPVGRGFSLGLGAKVLSIGDIEVTTEAAGGPTGERYSPTSTVIGLTLSRRLAERVAVGITGHLLHEAIRNETATGAAFDIGFQ
jgi:hypothetical protein